jgi:hypothetical protein
MIPGHLHALFWDVDPSTFDPAEYPDWTIFRVLDRGDEDAIRWLRATFPDDQIRRVILAEHFSWRNKPAKFWVSVYGKRL